ncbi:dihydrodipicolinate synthase family protein [Streptomyces yangpuensis]|uniref:Dihydrodipicolinate synthase family protein n=1 Tax=Streptomyces yangpuensis TaxID=1648182 RepID=A0ABY5Q878_9ACTN|nr:dihydrodipicolinate synthase family protein [Streptomyces yangpuensis]UUY52499.1 dihydrodipicolinate synthase family protein [Streptomyces yangpuensis]
MIRLPEPDGTLTAYEPTQTPRVFTPDATPFRSRSVVAAAHVLGDPLAANEPFGPPVGPPPPQSLDWDATLAFRRHLWAHGYTVGEALDTAHRGMGLDWATSAELIRRTGAEAKTVGGNVAAAIGTDQLDPFSPATLKDITVAFEEQLEVVDGAGAQAIIMCSPQLAAVAQGPEDYAELYGNLLRQASRPAIVHWILPEWIPFHAGYFGHQDTDAAFDALIAIVKDNIDKVDGVKLAPLTVERQAELRSRLPEGVRFYTSDTDAYPQLLAGDGRTHSHGLSPVFDPVAPLAAAAFRALDAGDEARSRELLDSTLELNRHLFTGPLRSTMFFKTGLAFLAWLSGHADHFRMVWGEQGARSVPHLSTAYRLADTLGLFPDPELAERRVRAYLTTAGFEQ